MVSARLTIVGFRRAREACLDEEFGAARAAFLAGYLRSVQGSHTAAFIIAGSTGVMAAVLALLIRGAKGHTPVRVAA